MEDTGESGMELYSHNGVLIKRHKAFKLRKDSKSVDDINCAGTLSIVQYGTLKCLEWKQTEVNVDSDTQDQGWAVVSTGHSSGRRSNSECERAEPVKVNAVELKSFRMSRYRHGEHLTFARRGEVQSYLTFIFPQKNADSFVGALLGNLKAHRSRHDRHLYHLDEDDTQETQELKRSFAELNLHSDSSMWNIIGQFKQRPYETTMGAFSKLTDVLLYRPPEQEDECSRTAELLNHSLTLEEDTVMTNVSGEEYEVVSSKASSISLPSRPDVTRCSPLSLEQWAQAMDDNGKVTDVLAMKNIIFRGGVTPALRYEVWKFLLGYYPWSSTFTERANLRKTKVEEYYHMKQQWKSMTPGQEERFSDFRDRKSLIEKDVKRTDRALPFYAGEDNPNVELLYNILMTYVMYNFDLGYVQGMSDLLSPLLQLMTNEADAFWCFVGFMERTCTNFDMDQAGMKLQLQQLHTLLGVVDPQLTRYLDLHESSNMFFCFRWLLVLFKREFTQEKIMRLWEVLWSDLPCPNFHLLFCAAILDTEKETFYSNNYGFTEILKHVNDLSLHIDLDSTLAKAEGLHEQLLAVASKLPDALRITIGLEPLNFSEEESADATDDDTEDVGDVHPEHDSSIETVTIGADAEVAFERAISSQFF